jgi:hypothetical protein
VKIELKGDLLGDISLSIDITFSSRNKKRFLNFKIWKDIDLIIEILHMGNMPQELHPMHNFLVLP